MPIQQAHLFYLQKYLLRTIRWRDGWFLDGFGAPHVFFNFSGFSEIVNSDSDRNTSLRPGGPTNIAQSSDNKLAKDGSGDGGGYLRESSCRGGTRQQLQQGANVFPTAVQTMGRRRHKPQAGNAGSCHRYYFCSIRWQLSRDNIATDTGLCFYKDSWQR
jgi:hypothetical protein